MKPVSYSKEAIRTLTRMPRTEATRVREKIAAHAADPSSQANNVKRLQGRDELRLRVGSWRVIIRETAVIAVLNVAPRQRAYR